MPALEPSAGSGIVDLAIEFQEHQSHPGPVPDEQWQPISPRGSVAQATTSHGHFYRLRYEGGGYQVVFVLGPRGKQLWVGWNEKVVLPTVCALMLGPILGCLLRLQGFIVLHGSAVASDGRVFVLMGPKGAGKTTTALAMVQQGAAIVTDDLVVLRPAEEAWLIPPGPPSLRLLPDSAQALCGSFDNLRSLGTDDMYLRKRSLELDAGQRTDALLPLERLYLLTERTLQGDSCSVTELGPADALGALMAHRMCTLFLDRDGHAADLRTLGLLCRQVGVRQVTRRHDLAELATIAQVLLGPSLSGSTPAG